MDAVTHPPAPVNEPTLSYAPGSPERKELQAELARQESGELELTATIGGRRQWGSGADFSRYGGHTSCLAITRDESDVPTLVLDAGTGLRSLTSLLGGEAFDGSIVLSHLHWDHMMGLPFFAAGDREQARVDLYVPAQEHRSGRDLLAQSFSPPAFPIPPEGLHGEWTFHDMAAGEHALEGCRVSAFDVQHKGGRTFCLVVADEGGSLAYAPDHAPLAGVTDELKAALRGVDVLVHDAQFLEHERPVAVDYGHATVQDAITLARECEVGTVVLFHHSPARTDAAMDEVAEWARTVAHGLTLVVARERMTLDVRRPA